MTPLRCPGFRYGPKVRSQAYNGTTVYHVEQKGFWMDASMVGPTKPTVDDAVRAWNRIVKAKATCHARSSTACRN